MFATLFFPSQVHWIVYLAIAGHLLVQVGIVFRVVMRRLSVGETLAWILIVFVFPVAGLLVYLVMGELRLGGRRANRFIEVFLPIQQWLEHHAIRHQVPWSRLGVEAEPLARLAQLSLGIPALPNNRLQLIDTWQEVFQRLICDIDAAEETCHLEFYIWRQGGEIDHVAQALMRAAERGVICRVLVDALGSRTFLRSKTAATLRSAGVEIQAAMQGGLLRIPFVRFDIRLHRKIVVIDGKLAYTGSLNLVDPRYFKKEAGVGEWIDAMVRVEGPAVEALAITFVADWYVETDSELEELKRTGGVELQPTHGSAAVQVLPSGPAYHAGAIEQVLLMAVYAARRELILTTPYFVPSESLRIALVSAAMRGVKVILIVPAKVDSRLVRYASQAFQGELLRAGVRIAKFDGGLLHTKSVTIDGEISLFGSLNLDPRSFRLNFEISLAIYDPQFTSQLRKLQQAYLDQSELMNLDLWHARPMPQRVAENCARLFGPLL